MNRISTGLVGFGLSGKIFHAPFLHVNKSFELKMVVERHHEESKKIYPYVEVVKSITDLLQDKEIEMVVLGVPNICHYQYTKECLEAGKHVVVEKPFAPSAREADELIDIARSVGRKIFVYHNRRWDGIFLTVKQVIESGRVGDVLEYEAHFDRFTPDVDPGNWRDRPLPGSGILYDLGPHLIDQALVLFGMPGYIFADIRNQRRNSDVDDYFELNLFYEKMKVILKAGMFVKEKGPSFIVHGTQGSFVTYGLDPQEELLKRGAMPEGDNWGKYDPESYGILHSVVTGVSYRDPVETIPGNYHGFYDNIFDVLRNDAEMTVTPQQARDVIRIIEYAFQSSETKRIISYIDS